MQDRKKLPFLFPMNWSYSNEILILTYRFVSQILIKVLLKSISQFWWNIIEQDTYESFTIDSAYSDFHLLSLFEIFCKYLLKKNLKRRIKNDFSIFRKTAGIRCDQKSRNFSFFNDWLIITKICLRYKYLWVLMHHHLLSSH